MTRNIIVSFPEAQFHTLANLLQLICVAGLKMDGTGDAIPTNEQLHEVWNTMLGAVFNPKSVGETPAEIEDAG